MKVEYSLSSCVLIGCNFAFEHPFFACPIGCASKIANPRIRVPRKKFVHPCVFKIDVLEDFGKFTAKRLYQILYSVKLHTSILQPYCRKEPG